MGAWGKGQNFSVLNRLEGAPRGLMLILGPEAGRHVPGALDGESGHRTPDILRGVQAPRI